MKPKTNRKGDKNESKEYDRCQTPHYALDPLLPYLPSHWSIWEPACGEGQMVTKLKMESFNVCAGDILTGENFFEYTPGYDCQVTNPPFSIKYEWLARTYRLGQPFALLMQIYTLGAVKGNSLYDKYGVEVIFINPRINFKMPELGYGGSGANFSTAWFTWGLNIGKQMTFATVSPYPDAQMPLFKMPVQNGRGRMVQGELFGEGFDNSAERERAGFVSGPTQGRGV